MKFNGNKTYLLSIAGGLYAAIGVFMGWLEPKDATDLIFGALAAASLRHGVTKSGPNGEAKP